MELLLLKVLADRKRLTMLKSAVPTDMLTPEVSTLLQWYEYYFSQFPNANHVIAEDLKMLVKLRSPVGSEDQQAITNHLIDKHLGEPVAEERVRGVTNMLYELAYSGEAAAIISKYQNGEEIDVVFEMANLTRKYAQHKGQNTPDTFEDTDIATILAEEADSNGIKFRFLKCLHDTIKSLSGGADILIGARPDKGKTSFVAATVVDFAPQCVEYFGPNRPILWLVNEGAAKRIKPRIYQAALKKTLEEITDLSNQGKLVEEYCKAIKADKDYIRVKNAHGMTMAQIEQVIESMNPCMVVYDMLANVHLSKGMASGSKVSDLETLGQVKRELAVTYDHIALSTVQISAEGANQLHPPESAMKDSKTALQGACDVIILLGNLDNPIAADMRGVSTPKNKFAIAGQPGCVRAEVTFDAPRCAFYDGGS